METSLSNFVIHEHHVTNRSENNIRLGIYDYQPGEKLGMEVLIETQGGAGVENQLKQKDIDEAVCVVLVNDVALEGLDRFKGKKVLKMGVSDLIKKSDAVMKKIHDSFQ